MITEEGGGLCDGTLRLGRGWGQTIVRQQMSLPSKGSSALIFTVCRVFMLLMTISSSSKTFLAIVVEPVGGFPIVMSIVLKPS